MVIIIIYQGVFLLRSCGCVSSASIQVYLHNSYIIYIYVECNLFSVVAPGNSYNLYRGKTYTRTGKGKKKKISVQITNVSAKEEGCIEKEKAIL